MYFGVFMDRSELTVDGYIFANLKDAELAKNEIRKIEYLEKHTDLSNLSIAKSVYEKAVEERFFNTPIGLVFLRDIKKAVETATGEELTPVPLYTTFSRIELSNEKKPPRKLTKQQKNELTLKQKYRNAVLIAVIFGFLSFALLAITLNGTTPNAINYKKAITNQYAEWEQNLKDREAVIREKEREYNIEVNP